MAQHRNHRHRTILVKSFLCIICIAAFFAAGALEQRKEFNVPLAFMTVSFDERHECQEVFITFGSSEEGFGISSGDDRYVKDTRRMRTDEIFREQRGQENLLSPFEAKVINHVCSTFGSTLDIFESDLKAQRWNRLLYLDGYFPPFFKAFYYLLTSARDDNALPAVVNIPDSLFDNSLVSPKSDNRIAFWRGSPDHTMKLRIAAKELMYQIKQWQKLELANPKRDAFEDHSEKFVEAYELFIRLYFSIPPIK